MIFFAIFWPDWIEFAVMKPKFNGSAMAAARRVAGMDQAELARRVRRNRVTISDIERGKLQPGSELAGGIAEVLEMEAEALYVADQATAPANTVSLTIEELQVIDAMRRTGDVERAKIWAFAQGLAAGGGPQGAASAAELAEAIENASRSDRAGNDSQAGSA